MFSLRCKDRDSYSHFTFTCTVYNEHTNSDKKGSPYSITERRAPELIPALGSQPAGNVRHKPGGKLRLLSARPAVTSPACRLVPVSLLGEQRHDECDQFT